MYKEKIMGERVGELVLNREIRHIAIANAQTLFIKGKQSWHAVSCVCIDREGEAVLLYTDLYTSQYFR